MLRLIPLPYKLGAIALLVLAAAWWLHSYGSKCRAEGEASGEARITLQWQADTAARDKATADAIAAAQKRAENAKKHNDEVLTDANAKLAAIDADRTSLSGLLHHANDQIHRLTAGQASDRLGLDVLTGIAARTAEVDRRYDEYDRACQRDAVRFGALQDQLREQL